VLYLTKMKMKEQLFKVILARWEDGTATTTLVKAKNLEEAKREAWKNWRSVSVEEVPFDADAEVPSAEVVG
jgi:hypothetical protein